VEIVCQGCGAKLSLPDDKLPAAAGALQATCPRCKAKMVIPGRATAEPTPYAAGWLERYEEGVPVALVLHEDDETARAIGQDLVTLGYRITRAESVAEAQARIKLNTYELVVLHEGFGAEGGESGGGASGVNGSPLLGFLNTLPMSSRRQMFVALLGASLATQDRMEAFRRSVNLTVSEGDLPSLAKILKNSIVEHEVFYRVFNETLRGLGRV
jgi:hypothetical protein